MRRGWGARFISRRKSSGPASASPTTRPPAAAAAEEHPCPRIRRRRRRRRAIAFLDSRMVWGRWTQPRVCRGRADKRTSPRTIVSRDCRPPPRRRSSGPRRRRIHSIALGIRHSVEQVLRCRRRRRRHSHRCGKIAPPPRCRRLRRHRPTLTKMAIMGGIRSP